jgi:phage protein D/phage baseplate assembly protein gpV
VPPQEYGTRPLVRLDGQQVPAPLEAQLAAVDVETDLIAPGRCVLTFTDPSRSLVEDLGVDVDQTVEVRASAVDETQDKTLFSGKVFAIDLETDERGSRVHVRAYEGSHGLRQRRQVKSWNDVTDADLVAELARDAGVATGQVDASSHLHPHVSQLNQTHWDFLSERALRSGRVLFMADAKLHFTPLPEATGGPATGGFQSSDPLELIPGHNVDYFRGGITATGQVGDVEARGWDPRTKREVVASRRPEARSARGRTTPAEVGVALGSPTRVVSVPALSDHTLVDELAEAVGGTVAGAYAYAEVHATGDPRLQAGVVVSVGECGRLDGAYTVTTARHRFGDKGYHTELWLSDRHDRSIYGLAGHGRDGTGPGVRPAIVTNVEDPEKLGRVKLKYPWLADDFETDWSRVVQLGAGPERGLLWYPEVGDEVLVDFIEPWAPVVLGGLFNGEDVAPFAGFDDHGDGRIDKRGMRTRIGHELYLDDTAGEERIEIRSANGKVSLVLDQAGRKVVIDCDGDVEITCGGNATVRSDGNVTLKAGGNAELSAGGNLTLDAGGRVAVSGSMIALN